MLDHPEFARKMKSNLVLIGSGRLAFQVADLINESKLYKSYETFSYCRHAPTSSATPFQRISSLPRQFSYLVAVGNPSQRRDEANAVAQKGLSARPINVISSSCYIAKNSSIIGESGIIALPRAIINSWARIGSFSIIGSGAIIEHDSNIGEYCTIGPGAAICGKVEIGNLSFIGANATVIQAISIGSCAVIGAGTVVIRKVEDHCIGIGNPCRIIRKSTIDCNPL